METKKIPRYGNEREGIAVEYRITHPGTIHGYSLDPNFEYKWEVGNFKEILEQEFAALKRIADKYDRPMSEWTPLTIRLAFEHEPSLRYYAKKKTGRPIKWDEMRGACLWFDVESYCRRTGHTVAAACVHLSKEHKDPSKNSYWAGYKALETAYHQHAMKSPLTTGFIRIVDRMGWENFVIICDKIFAPENREKTLDDWKLGACP